MRSGVKIQYMNAFIFNLLKPNILGGIAICDFILMGGVTFLRQSVTEREVGVEQTGKTRDVIYGRPPNDFFFYVREFCAKSFLVFIATII
jgi:hypothetical protein